MSAFRTIGATEVTTVDCHKQVRSWRLLRAIIELLIPTCNRNFEQPDQISTKSPRKSSYSSPNFANSPSSSSSSSSIITGTIFGYKRGKVKFCIQTKSTVLLLELAVPTKILAREMRGGLLRIALESNNNCSSNESLLETAVWKMYCNGRRVGYAVRRRPSKADMEVMSKMKSVVVGAGVIDGKEIGCEEDDIMYLRGNFERVRGSSDAESFHLIDPDGNINQDLSIFFLRSR